MPKKTPTPDKEQRREELQQVIETSQTATAAAWQGIRAIDLEGAYYVIFAPVHGYVCSPESWDPSPTAEAVTKYETPRGALESLQANPTSGDLVIKRVLADGKIDNTFHSEYYPPNNRRDSTWQNDWKFFDTNGEL